MSTDMIFWISTREGHDVRNQVHPDPYQGYEHEGSLQRATGQTVPKVWQRQGVFRCQSKVFLVSGGLPDQSQY